MELVGEGVRGGQLEELSTASAPVRGTRIVHKSTGLPPGSVGVFLCRWAFLAQRFPREYEAVMVLHKSIQHGVGHRLIVFGELRLGYICEPSRHEFGVCHSHLPVSRLGPCKCQ